MCERGGAREKEKIEGEREDREGRESMCENEREAHAHSTEWQAEFQQF